MSRVVTSLILALLLVPPPMFAGYSTVKQSVRALQGLTATGTRNICTTTSINSDKHYWLTAAHCVTGGSMGLTVDGHVADVAFVDEVADVAVLVTPDYSLPALKLRSTRPAVEQRIRIVGHPLGIGDVQVFNGRISSLLTHWEEEDGSFSPYMLFDMTACGGNSGSAVVDLNDRVVSILQIGFGEGCSAFTGGIPWETLARLVGKYFRG
jgi:S1-C subfamily serine protease